MLDIHRGSMSLVCTPACNMLLNLMVRGNGSFTARVSQVLSRQSLLEHTDDVSAEEGVDPAHDQGVGDDHGHVVLHHAHHAVHLTRVGQRVRRRLALPIRLFQEGPGLVSSGEVLATSLKGPLRDGVVVGAQNGAATERALLAHARGVELLRLRSQHD